MAGCAHHGLRRRLPQQPRTTIWGGTEPQLHGAPFGRVPPRDAQPLPAGLLHRRRTHTRWWASAHRRRPRVGRRRSHPRRTARRHYRRQALRFWMGRVGLPNAMETLKLIGEKTGNDMFNTIVQLYFSTFNKPEDMTKGRIQLNWESASRWAVDLN